MTLFSTLVTMLKSLSFSMNLSTYLWTLLLGMMRGLWDMDSQEILRWVMSHLFFISNMTFSQVYEMNLSDWQFKVLSPIFTVHWGLQKKKGRPTWRERQNSNNRKKFQHFKKEIFAKYNKDYLKEARRDLENEMKHNKNKTVKGYKRVQNIPKLINSYL